MAAPRILHAQGRVAESMAAHVRCEIHDWQPAELSFRALFLADKAPDWKVDVRVAREGGAVLQTGRAARLFNDGGGDAALGSLECPYARADACVSFDGDFVRVRVDSADALPFWAECTFAARGDVALPAFAYYTAEYGIPGAEEVAIY